MIPRLALSSRKQFVVLLLQTGARVGEGGHAPHQGDAIAVGVSFTSGGGKMETGLLVKLPSRLHHNAFVVKNHEVNRKFFEDVLGIPLVATWCERNYSAEMQREV